MSESYAALNLTATSAAAFDWLEDVILAETDVERIRSECDPQPPRLTTFVVVLSNVNVNPMHLGISSEAIIAASRVECRAN
ncbi:MAG: hypothetical protein DMG55_32755 [Acidobacteria bacterium]|nr:MAG: hypothetical protein DMG55_32755 [Acidobacteriota bacterium]